MTGGAGNNANALFHAAAGEPEDQAAAISFMVSDDAAFMSGQTMLVDGGEGHV